MMARKGINKNSPHGKTLQWELLIYLYELKAGGRLRQGATQIDLLVELQISPKGRHNFRRPRLTKREGLEKCQFTWRD